MERQQWRWVLVVFAAGLLVLGVALLGAGVVSPVWVQAQADGMAGDGQAQSITPTRLERMQARSLVYGIILVVLAVGLLGVRKPLGAWLASGEVEADGQLRGWRQELNSLGRQGWLGLGALMALGLGVRLWFVNVPMEVDEARSALMAYAGVVRPWTSYDPNNHLLNTVLMSWCAALLGEGRWIVRLPALTAGLLLIPATFFLFRRLASSPAAWIAAAGVAACPYLVHYSVTARGYTMVALATVLAWWIGAEVVQRHRPANCVALGVVLALGMAAVPTMLFPATAIGVWMVAEWWWSGRRRAFWAGACFAAVVGVLVTLLIYLPIFITVGVESVMGNQFVVAQLHDGVWSLMWARAATFLASAHDGLGPWLPWALWGLVGLSLLVGHREGQARVPPVAALALGMALVLVVHPTAPPARVWTFMLPMLIGAMAVGLMALVALCSGHRRARAQHLTAGVTLAMLLVGSGGLLLRPEPLQVPGDLAWRLHAGPTLAYLASAIGPGDRALPIYPPRSIVAYELRARGIRTAFFDDPLRAQGNCYLVQTEPLESVNARLTFLGLPPVSPQDLQSVWSDAWTKVWIVSPSWRERALANKPQQQ